MNLAAGRLFQPGEQAQQRGFSGTGGTDDGQRFVRVQVQADIVENIEMSAGCLNGITDVITAQQFLLGIRSRHE